MIISCNQCSKKFELNSNLIPAEGRLLQCSSCNHQWFYKKKIEEEKILINPEEEKILINPEEEILINPEEEISINPEEEILINTEVEKKVSDNSTAISIEKTKILKNDNKKIKSKIKTTKVRFLNIIIVFVISFIALILIMETFKFRIETMIPDFQFILNNLYNSIYDFYLFLNDLF